MPSIMTRLAGRGAALLRVRWVVRAPIWLYRARLGMVLGSRMLMLEHIGRRSGARRHVVLEVIGHPSPDTYVVVSGFGERAQWFRNVRADPHVRVFVGSRAPAPATAEVLDPDEAAAALAGYAAAHPRAWATLKPVLEQTLGARIGEDRSNELPLLALHLT
jgi:deazaflavin-dependent oxidoreductase (nitroreductase family)